MGGLVAVDWGTSSLRGALLDGHGAVREERSFPRGIMTVEPGGFAAVFESSFGDWMSDAPLALVCGMAGSRQGWLEAPYAHCPAGFTEIASALAWAQAGRIAIVPGLTYSHAGVPDVMRGEETQVLGALQLLGLSDATLVMPGTHSKWVPVDAGRISGFTTYMTGEFYALLRRHSILSRGMTEGDDAFDGDAFAQGVRAASESTGILRTAFSARTLGLFDRVGSLALPSYLSGLLIGDELRSQGPLPNAVVIVGAPELVHRYTAALTHFGVTDVRAVGSEAAWRGLHAIARTVS